MGCDIHGTFEVYRYDGWRYAGILTWFVGRSYDTFGCLFGVRNMSRFEPLFPDRGLPDERSRRLDNRIDDWGGEESVGRIDFYSPTWFTLDELDSVDWDEPAEEPDRRIAVVNEEGETQAKASYMGGVHESLTEEELKRAREGEWIELTPTDGEKRYATHKTLTRRESLSGAWEWVLFDYMPVLAERCDDDSQVRLTVWFDN